MMEMNKKYEVIITDTDINGNGIVRIDNFVVFVTNALKNEKLLIEITELNKRFAKAKIIKIIKPSILRKEPLCKYYNECGSCSLMHIDYKDEMNIKYNTVKKLFNREIDIINLKNEYNYRNKAIFHIMNNKIGYYSENTHKIIEFDECFLVDKRINEIYKYFKNNNLSNITELLVRTTLDETMIKITGKYDYNDLINYIKIDSLYINDKCVYGNKYIVETINNTKYTIYPESFFQINREGMIHLYDRIKEYAGKGNNLLDLYCGTGTIGIYLKDNYKSITGIEINKSSILNANINKDINNLTNIQFILNDAKNALKNEYNTIIIDPPRNGLSNEVIKYLNNSKTNVIVYVSCNYKTLKRDTDLLTNYIIDEMSLVNMFSKTSHTECICKLIKK